MNKAEVKMNKPVYLGLSILGMTKIVMYEYWYGITKPNYEEKGNLCYTYMDSLIFHVKSEEVYADLAKDFKKRFDRWKYEFERPIPIGSAKNHKSNNGII